jgi:hypothetical protein
MIDIYIDELTPAAIDRGLELRQRFERTRIGLPPGAKPGSAEYQAAEGRYCRGGLRTFLDNQPKRKTK